MAQADGVVANGTGSAVRSDINNQYAALWSNHSGSTEPSTGKVAYQFWADTNTNILKIRNSGNSAWISLFTLAGGVDVDAASNFNEDVTFTGASANAVWDKSDNALEFADNAKCTFGASDLSLYHDGSNSYIHDGGTGQLRVSSSNFKVLNAAQSETIINAVQDGGVSLYYDNGLKLESISNGVQVWGHLRIPDSDGTNDKLQIGNGQDLQIFHNGNNSFIENDTGLLFLRAKAGENSINCHPNAEVQLYYDNVKQCETTADGMNIRDTHKFLTGVTNTRVFQSSNGICIRPNISGAGTNNSQGTFIRASANCSDIDDDDTVKFIVFGTGDVQNANNSYAAISDVNLKQDIVDAGSQWDDIKKLRVRKYRFKNNPTGPLQIGCIAQEAETVSPGLVDSDPDDGFKSLKYSVLYMKAIKALQEAITKIETLETKVAALEAK